MNLANFFNGFRLVRSSFLRWIVIWREGYCDFRSNQFWLSLQDEEFDWGQYLSNTVTKVLEDQILNFQKVLASSGLEVKPCSPLTQVHWKENNPRGLSWDSEKELWTIKEFSPLGILDIPMLEQAG